MSRNFKILIFEIKVWTKQQNEDINLIEKNRRLKFEQIKKQIEI